MKRTEGIAWPALLAVILLAAVSAGFPAEGQARQVVAVVGATFETAHSIRDNLKVYSGKEVVIHLRSGKTFQGYVKALGEHLVHLEKISGRDFYDALIRTEDITAIEARFRELK